MKWNGHCGSLFRITRGIRQGSILSPLFFNIFIDDLLTNLSEPAHGCRVEECIVNVLAYADDITVISNRVPDIQDMINICDQYASKWRFNYGIKKSKCMAMQDSSFLKQPEWCLGENVLENVDSLEVLGVIYSNDGLAAAHIENRIAKCRAAYYSMADAGLTYPGLQSEVKAHMWKSVCLPSLTYGTDTIAMTKKDLQLLRSTQGSLVKRSLGLGKHHHHSKLQEALHISDITKIHVRQVLSSFQNILKSNTPAKVLQLSLLAKYCSTGKTVPGTMVDRILKHGISPVRAAMQKIKHSIPIRQDGVVDSLKQLIYEENYVYPGSYEYVLTSLLTKSY